MARRLKITAVVEDAVIQNDDPLFKSRPEEPSMEHDVLRALRRLGHDVSVLGIYDRVEPMVERLGQQSPDLIFNLAEQFANDRRHDKHVAGLLEMMDIPFTGTGATGLLLARDKALCKHLLSSFDVGVPGFWVFPFSKNITLPRGIRFPLVVKPAFGDGSEGISNNSLVEDEVALYDRIEMLQDRFKQDVIAEEYIEGHEVYIGLLGNDRLQVLPAYEVRFGKENQGGPKLATYQVKWNKAYRDKWKIQFGFADLPKKLSERVAIACRKTFHALQLRDYARIDLRITSKEEIYVLEANPNPDITQGEEMAEGARKVGMSYSRFIARLAQLAMGRYARAARAA